MGTTVAGTKLASDCSLKAELSSIDKHSQGDSLIPAIITPSLTID